MTRKLYTVSKWDKEAGKGYATDGTSWEGDPIEFLIRDCDLDPSYDGHLLPGETITAVEKHGMGLHILFEIIVESGPRSINGTPVRQEPSMCFDPNPPAEVLRGAESGYGASKSQDKRLAIQGAPVTGKEYLELVRRVSALEAQVYGEEDNS